MSAARIVLLLLIAAGTVTAIVFALWTASADPHASVDRSALAPEWWKQGKCEECHRQDGEAGSKAPAYHSAQFRQFTHGRSGMGEERCLNCHSLQGCRDCHSLAPQNHTAGFRRPGVDSLDAQRHAALARVRPSTCLTCHGSFNVTCGACHTRSETDAWALAARDALACWPRLRAPTERP